MKTSSMRNAQWSHLANWSLDGRRSVTVSATAAVQQLRVRSGRVWITVPGGWGERAEDHWLAAGECITVPPGRCVWVDGWPEAEVEVFALPVPAIAAVRWWRTVRRALHRLIGRWPAAPRPCSPFSGRD